MTDSEAELLFLAIDRAEVQQVGITRLASLELNNLHRAPWCFGGSSLSTTLLDFAAWRGRDIFSCQLIAAGADPSEGVVSPNVWEKLPRAYVAWLARAAARLRRQLSASSVCVCGKMPSMLFLPCGHANCASCIWRQFESFHFGPLPELICAQCNATFDDPSMTFLAQRRGNHPSGPNVKIRVKPNLCRLWLFEYCPSRTLHQLWMDTFAAAIYNGTKSIPAAIMFRLADTPDDGKKVSLLCQRKTREEVAEPPALERIARRNAGESNFFLFGFLFGLPVLEPRRCRVCRVARPLWCFRVFLIGKHRKRRCFWCFFHTKDSKDSKDPAANDSNDPSALRPLSPPPFAPNARRVTFRALSPQEAEATKLKNQIFRWKTSKFSFQIQGKSLLYGINMTRIIFQALWTLDIEDIPVHPVSKW